MRHKNSLRFGGVLASLLLAGLFLGGCRESAEKAPPSDPHAGHNQSPEPDAHAGHNHGPGEGHENDDAKPEPDGELTAAEWCFEHGLPEAICTRCNAKLIAQFQERNDWCAGHNLPESQCERCNPGVMDQWREMGRKFAAATSTNNTAGGTPKSRRILSIDNDPNCQIEQTPVQLASADIAGKAGLQTEVVTTRHITAAVECPGVTAYDQTRFAHVTPRVSGVVTEVMADPGDPVETGTVLAIIESPALGEAKSRYIELRESHLMAQADLQRHNTIHDALESMLETSRRDVTSAEIRRLHAEARIGDAKSRLLRAHGELEFAQANYARETSLSERGLSSAQAIDTAKRNLDAAEAEFSATRESIDIEMEKEHLDVERAVSISKVALDATRRRLGILGLKEEQIQTLDEDKDLNLSRYELRSPIAGHVVLRHAVIGESVAEEDALFTVADLSRMWGMLDVNEMDLVSLRTGLPVEFIIDGLGGATVRGNLEWISSQVDERSRTLKARVGLSNESGRLRANMFGHARIILHDDEPLLAISEEAIQSDGCCRLVFVKTDDHTFTPRKVALGTSADGYVQITDGLEAGEAVVTTGSFLLKTEILKGNIGAGCCEVDPGR